MNSKIVATTGHLKKFEELTSQELDFWRKTVEQNAQYQRAFMTATFVEAVAKVDDKVRVLVLSANSQLVGVMPIRRHHTWLGRLGAFEPVAGEMTDYFGAVVEPGVTLNIDSILRPSGVGLVIFSHLDESQQLLGLTGDEPRIGLRTVVQGVGNEHWEQLRKIDKKLVADTERRERKLIAEHGQLTFELRSSSPQEDLDELIRLKKAQYARTGKDDAVLFDDANAALLHGLLGSNAVECAGVLSVMRVDGKLVAAHFGLLCNGVLHFWFPVYGKEYAAYSPGRILYRYVLSEGSAIGIKVLDRGEGDTQAKRDFANEEHRYFSGIWRTNNMQGYMARLALSALWRWQAHVK